MSIKRWLLNRRLLRDARTEYREAQRTYRQFPCKATEDDLIVARDCYRFLRHGKHQETKPCLTASQSTTAPG